MLLNHKILKEVSPDVIREAAGDLRMLGKNNTITFESENKTAYLQDRAVYDIERQGKRSVENYLEKYANTVSSMERRLLEAMSNAFYSLFTVEKIRKGAGADIADVFSGEKLFLADINLSRTLPEGCLLSCRVISLDGLNFTSGCACIFEKKQLISLKDNFVNLFEKNKDTLSWREMMRKYNPYFLKMMKQSGKEVWFL
ncbi:MAG: hypothetical protein V1662_03130 [Candidatus Omnitrophota bacterium]